MRTSLRVLAFLGGLTILANAHAQSSVTVTADVYIVQPTAIYKVSDLRFGAVVPGTSGGTVTLGTNGTRTATGTVVLPPQLAYGAASFNVLGSPNSVFTLTLPASLTLIRAGGLETMTVSNFVSSPSGTGTLNSGGTATVNVGARLTIAANQVLGAYSGSFNVTVGYP